MKYLGHLILLSVLNFEVEARFPGIHFVLFSQDGLRELNPNNLDQVNVTKPTTLILHGFIADLTLELYLVNVSTTLADKADRNVIFVDWGYRSIGNYASIVLFDVPDIAKQVADLVMQLHERGASLNSFHLIGASLGAHISGYVGRYIQEKVPQQKIHRITALDPAGPLYWRLFSYFKNPLSLGPTDAEIVDCLHSNGGLLGTRNNIGTVDFYLNGGSTQEYCVKQNFSIPVLDLAFVEVCNHVFGTVFYQLTIGSTEYKASTSRSACENVIVFGDSFDGKATGVYYIDTEDEFPFKTKC